MTSESDTPIAASKSSIQTSYPSSHTFRSHEPQSTTTRQEHYTTQWKHLIQRGYESNSSGILGKIERKLNEWFPQQRDNRGEIDPANPHYRTIRFIPRDPEVHHSDKQIREKAIEAEWNKIRYEQKALAHMHRPWALLTGFALGIVLGRTGRFRLGRIFGAGATCLALNEGIEWFNYRVIIFDDPAYERDLLRPDSHDYRARLFIFDLDRRKLVTPITILSSFFFGSGLALILSWALHVPRGPPLPSRLPPGITVKQAEAIFGGKQALLRHNPGGVIEWNTPMWPRSRPYTSDDPFEISPNHQPSDNAKRRYRIYMPQFHNWLASRTTVTAPTIVQIESRSDEPKQKNHSNERT